MHLISQLFRFRVEDRSLVLLVHSGPDVTVEEGNLGASTASVWNLAHDPVYQVP